MMVCAARCRGIPVPAGPPSGAIGFCELRLTRHCDQRHRIYVENWRKTLYRLLKLP